MSVRSIAAYSFLSWSRQGIGNHVRESDLDEAVTARASIDVSLRITAERLNGTSAVEDLPPRDVLLYGPGDVIGIDPKAIVRSEPRNWITNFESNYVPFVEFYDEDFPWRYTPAKPSEDGGRLRPWLTLVVLREDEIAGEGAAGLERPLSYIQVTDAAEKFPPPDQLWAWAHVHVNGAFTTLNDPAAVATQLEDTLRVDRDLAYSRLLCPRVLEPNTAYHAFLVPTFETGRLAGLGRDPVGAPFATHSAWEPYAAREEPEFFPYYHRWYFRTGTVGDFEYLVRLLQPRTVDPRVGRRDMDVQSPGANLPPIPELGGILRLGGALRAPLITLSDVAREEYDRFEEWGKPYPHAFQTALTSLVNLADAYRTMSASAALAAAAIPTVEEDEDPLIVPPLYGRWHSETNRLVAADGDPGQKRWVHELNLDPRHRVAAGFGTHVVQKNQEGYMEASWQQVGKVLDANQKIRFGQMARLTSLVWHSRELVAARQQSPTQYLTMAAPVQRRVVVGGFTVQHKVGRSVLPVAAMSKTFRQARRPRGRIERLVGYDARRPAGDLLRRMNLPDGDPDKVSAAAPKVLAPALPTAEGLSQQLLPRGVLGAWLAAAAERPWLLALVALAALLLALLAYAIAPAFGILIAVVMAGAAVWTLRQLPRIRAARALDPATRTAASVDDMPSSPDFRLLPPAAEATAPARGSTDSAEAQRFKSALRNAFVVDDGERPIDGDDGERGTIDMPALADAVLAELNPERTITKRVMIGVQIPDRIRGRLPATFDEVMVYPEIDVPMYEPLKDISSELFLPNIQLIENNSITLLETNQKFIESYMVGLNHEFARELLWREYPTDQRGSYFRQFWDVRDFLVAAQTPQELEALRERLRDIPELHKWPVNTELGAHDHREAQGDKEDEVVLVVRGELLKKYPTAVIYAHRAVWERTGDGDIDRAKPRKLAPLTEAQAADPPSDLLKTPLYEAKVDPDIYFFGFDLTAEQARGGEVIEGEEDPGWFFVIRERPGEPRFGLDLPRTGGGEVELNTWNDLSWTDVMADYEPGAFLRAGETAHTLTDPGAGSDEKEQYEEDKAYQWRAGTQSAELAYILYQVPVMIAVHAAEMLEKPE